MLVPRLEWAYAANPLPSDIIPFNPIPSVFSEADDDDSDDDEYYEPVYPCECRLPDKCCREVDGCINRAMCVECKQGECFCGDSCANGRFQRRDYAPVEVFPTPGKGHGLRCLVDLPA